MYAASLSPEIGPVKTSPHLLVKFHRAQPRDNLDHHCGGQPECKELQSKRMTLARIRGFLSDSTYFTNVRLRKEMKGLI